MIPAPVHILIVDDLEENLLALQGLLAEDGVVLLKALSGREALEHLLVHDVALALVDLQMPEMDGFELAELMRGTERTRHVPIIFVTAGARDAKRVFRGYEVGAVDFLHKPIDPVLLRHKVSTFVALHRQKLELARLADELRETLHVNEMFVAAVSHDLRSPLSTVLLGAAMLTRDAVDPAAKRTLTRIKSSAERMANMLEQLYDLARARLGGGIPVTPKDANFRPIVEGVVEELRQVHPDRLVETDYDGTDMRGYWDQERLAQVVANLVSNALRYSPPTSRVRVAVRALGDVIVLDVHNEGAISQEMQTCLFDPFRRGSHPGRDSLGLGLYIVKRILEAHQGTIEVHSSEEEGTTFHVELPRRAREAT